MEDSSLPFTLATLALGSSDTQTVEAVVETFNVVLRHKREWFYAHNRLMYNVRARIAIIRSTCILTTQ
eukprot:3851572-Pyramimonas_sp.AAC.1